MCATIPAGPLSHESSLSYSTDPPYAAGATSARNSTAKLKADLNTKVARRGPLNDVELISCALQAVMLWSGPRLGRCWILQLTQLEYDVSQVARP
jgi:hypothetical protein